MAWAEKDKNTCVSASSVSTDNSASSSLCDLLYPRTFNATKHAGVHVVKRSLTEIYPLLNTYERTLQNCNAL